MRHETHPYYVGLLKAAELHGATHHAVMEFQAISSKRLPKLRAGRNLIVFYFRKDMASVILLHAAANATILIAAAWADGPLWFFV